MGIDVQKLVTGGLQRLSQPARQVFCTLDNAAHGQELMPPTHAAMANLPQIEMVRVKQIGLMAPTVQLRLRDGEIDLMKPSDLGGSDGIGSAWKMPSVTKFQERFGQW